MTTKLINPTINLKELYKGIQDEGDEKIIGKQNIQNIRKYINDNDEIASTEKNIVFEDFNSINYKCVIKSDNKYISDYVLKLPYDESLNIYTDILLFLRWQVGGESYSSCNIYVLEFLNWLFGKELEIKNDSSFSKKNFLLSAESNDSAKKDDYLYLPLSSNINVYNTNTTLFHDYTLNLNFKGTYLSLLKKLNKRIELLYKEYDIKNNELTEKFNFNPISNAQKFIQEQIYHNIIEGNANELKKTRLMFNHPIFCLFVYGFEKEDISDLQIIFDGKYVYDLILKEKKPKIYVLEFADPLLFNTIFSEPISNTDIFNKKTINFSRIDNCEIRFKKTNNKSFEFNVAGLNYNYMRILSGMAGMCYGS